MGGGVQNSSVSGRTPFSGTDKARYQRVCVRVRAGDSECVCGCPCNLVHKPRLAAGYTVTTALSPQQLLRCHNKDPITLRLSTRCLYEPPPVCLLASHWPSSPSVRAGYETSCAINSVFLRPFIVPVRSNFPVFCLQSQTLSTPLACILSPRCFPLTGDGENIASAGSSHPS